MNSSRGSGSSSSCGVDALFVHPRFFNEKLKRNARWKTFPWIADKRRCRSSQTGDIAVRRTSRKTPTCCASQGIHDRQAGRGAAVAIQGACLRSRGLISLITLKSGTRYFDYVNEDFSAERAIGRLKEFSKYYACNFFFGHLLKSASQGASSIPDLYEKAMRFLSARPRVVAETSGFRDLGRVRIRNYV